MQKVDTILAHGTVVTMDDDYTIHPDGAVAIQDDRIVAAGPAARIMAEYSAAETVDCSGHIVMPGLINAHTHASMTLLRGLADDLRLDVWLMGYIMPVEREFVTPEFCELGTTLACAEMIRGGTTTFADMYYFEADVARATARAGMRGVLCQTILKFPSPDAPTFEDSLQATRDFIDQWKDHPLITPTIAPHAPYSNTEETLQRASRIASEHGLPLMIHIAETEREQKENLQQYGKTQVPWIKDNNVLDVPIMAAHCVHIDEHEMRMIKKHNGSAVHCPSANLKLSSGIAPVARMLELGLNVAIGTDGPASNNDLDMFEEMRLTALIAKVRTMNPTDVPARQALTMATRNGAKALQLDDVTGCLTAGRRADIIVVQSEPIHNMPHFDFNPDSIYSRLVYATHSGDVRDTMVNGQWLMRDRALLTIDEKAVLSQSRAYARAVGDFMSAREDDILGKLVAVGIDVERAESFEIQVKAVIDDASIIEELLSDENVEVMRAVHYRQYDNYFLFDDEQKGRVRYREDDRLDMNGEVESVRMRLTYTTGQKESVVDDAVLLSHSRFIAPASHPLRFYQEFFQPDYEKRVIKDRRRWRIEYRDELFFINVDKLIEPEADTMFLEVKSRTWSRHDAENKAHLVKEMMSILGIGQHQIVRDDYLDTVTTT